MLQARETVQFRTDKRANSIPSDHHIFAIWLGLQAFHDIQLDLGLSLAIELHLIREQAHLSG